VDDEPAPPVLGRLGRRRRDLRLGLGDGRLDGGFGLGLGDGARTAKEVLRLVDADLFLRLRGAEERAGGGLGGLVRELRRVNLFARLLLGRQRIVRSKGVVRRDLRLVRPLFLILVHGSS
jgi:hypothetical protein